MYKYVQQWIPQRNNGIENKKIEGEKWTEKFQVQKSTIKVHDPTFQVTLHYYASYFLFTGLVDCQDI